MKKMISLCLACTLVLLTACSNGNNKKETLKSIQLDPEANKVLVDTDADIHIDTDPDNIQLNDKDFTSSGGNVKVNKDNAEFTASEEGTYTISAKRGNITSNTVTITVVSDESDLAAANDEQTTTNDNSQTTDTSTASNSTQTSNTTQTQNPGEASPDAIDVATILSDPDDYVGKTITIIGSLPQTPAYDSNNQPYEIIYPTAGGSNINDPSDRLRLEGAKLTIGCCIAELTGTLEKKQVGNDQYVFDVSSYEEVLDESPRPLNSK
ncbi:hypothetical protein [Dubosiella newyorkensis]|uniref:hypothetical protein n=1 Tax=Dubosiella newyorkensis TaxID=1862672 RepID=UPI00272B35B1|nr:hypothetical protein [Dubosiella newyorkensis]